MKKTFKFSGKEDDSIAYFTAILVFSNEERAKECFKLIESSVCLGEKLFDDGEVLKTSCTSFERFARLIIQKNKILVSVRYENTNGFNDDDIEDIERDSSHITEQIETLIGPFEEEEAKA